MLAFLGIRARGNLPLLVGGTMLYFRALRGGLDDLPPADPAREAAQAPTCMATTTWKSTESSVATDPEERRTSSFRAKIPTQGPSAPYCCCRCSDCRYLWNGWGRFARC